MAEWALVSRSILALLAEAGIEGGVQRLPTTSLRRLDDLKHRVALALVEELRDEWCERLGETFGGGIPRKHLIWV